MHFGAAIPTCMEGLFYEPSFTSRESLIRIAKSAESLGFDSIWGNDHIVTMNYLKNQLKSPPNFYEPLITLAFLSNVTTDVKLGTCVLVLSNRNPVIVAKQVATLDQLSRGRLILGVGIGAYREEFEAANSRLSLGKRGDILEEGIKVLRELLTKKKASFEGKYFRFNEIEVYPKPVQDSFPIWVGGNSENSVKRAAELGEGWLGASLFPTEIENAKKKMKNYAAQAGKDHSGIEIAPNYSSCIAKTDAEASRKFRQSLGYKHVVSLSRSTFRHDPNYLESVEKRRLIGSPDSMIDKLQVLGDAGLTYPILNFVANGLDDLIAAMELFSKEVMPSFR